MTSWFAPAKRRLHLRGLLYHCGPSTPSAICMESQERGYFQEVVKAPGLTTAEQSDITARPKAFNSISGVTLAHGSLGGSGSVNSVHLL